MISLVSYTCLIAGISNMSPFAVVTDEQRSNTVKRVRESVCTTKGTAYSSVSSRFLFRTNTRSTASGRAYYSSRGSRTFMTSWGSGCPLMSCRVKERYVPIEFWNRRYQQKRLASAFTIVLSDSTHRGCACSPGSGVACIYTRLVFRKLT